MILFNFSGLWMVALGKTLIHSVWVGFLILSLIRMILIPIPEKFSKLRYGITATGLFLMFCSVIGIFILIYKPLLSTGASSYPPRFIPQVYAVLSSESKSTGIYQVFNMLAEIYFIGALAMLFRSAVSFRYISMIRKSGKRIDPEWHLKFSRISGLLGIRRSVDFLESARIKGPMLVGFLKPAVIIPAGMLTNLPFSQIETILMHELYHLKRMDYLVNIMQLFMEGLLFYNPSIWILSGMVRKERENCCDDGVLNEIKNPVNYAKALVHIAEQQHFSRLVPGAIGKSRNHLKSRINRILNTDTMKTNMREKAVSLALLAGSIVVMLVVNGFSAGPSFVRSEKMTSEISAKPVDQTAGIPQDTIPKNNPETEKQKILKEIEEIDWEEMKAEIEDARLEALKEIEEIDWEGMKAEIEQARMEALKQVKEIDWEQIKAEMEEARREALEQINEIDWEEIRNEIKRSIVSVDSIRIEMDQ